MLKLWLKIRYVLRTISNYILFILFTSIGLIFIIDFWLLNYNEMFPGGAKIGSIIENLCIANVSAFVFYFFLVYLPEIKDKQIVYGFVKRYGELIIEDGENFLHALAQSINYPIKEELPSDDELIIISSKIRPTDPSPMLTSSLDITANWIEYLQYNRQRFEQFSSIILIQTKFLDSDYIKSLMSIHQCNLFAFLRILTTNNLGNKSLKDYITSILAYKSSIANFKNVHYNVCEVYAAKG